MEITAIYIYKVTHGIYWHFL